MSFFEDEDDEPPVTEARAPRRTRAGGPGRAGGSGRRPPSGAEQAIQQRRIGAIVVVIIVVILMGFLIHSCQASDTTNSLKNYNVAVSKLVDESDSVGSQLQTAMKSSKSPGGLIQTVIDLNHQAGAQLASAQGLDAPDQMAAAQQHFLTAMQMRADGLQEIANNISQALNSGNANASSSAVTAITGAMARFFASDVLYKSYAVPEIASALHGDGIQVGGINGVTINGGQFLDDLGWLDSSFVASTIGAATTGSGGGSGAVNAGDSNTGSGPFGHALNSVSVGGTALTQGTPVTLTASTSKTWVLNITNGGVNTEYNVGCKVTISGTGVSGETILSKTTAGETTNCTVTLKSAPPTGSYTVTAEVVPVPGETNTANNTLSYTVDFQ